MTNPPEMPAAVPVATRETLGALLDKQRAAFRRSAPGYRDRLDALQALGEAVIDWKDEIARAADEDFGGRARQETLALELAPLVDGIRHARKHLASWMKPRHVSVGINFFPARARILYQPVGVVGILGAWNYQTYLSLSPLIDAIAAGNHAMIKPSELAPCTAEVLRKLIASLFSEEYVAVVTGDAQVAAAFSALPFDHLLFTGSTRVGKLVMKAASENLTPVTLELGGKCPAILHPEFPLRTALERIMTGKLYNAGQTCLAPDYIFVHESRREEVVRVALEVARALYPKWEENPDYTHILSIQHFERLNEYVRDAATKGATVVTFGAEPETQRPTDAPRTESSHRDRVFVPILLFDVDDSMLVLREEIFGPILPVMTYRDLHEALAYVNTHPRPLALYYFDLDTRRIERVLNTTWSGGVTVNDVIYHIAQNNLPFGGVGPSGMGHYHGFAGFETFSKKKGIFLQSRFSSLKFLRPPYGPTAERVIRFLLRK
jgi:coniferyl-aldehyde dehydrogenase